MAGDFNVDCPVGGHRGDCADAYERLTEGGELVVVEIANEHATTCSSYNSVLDLFFVGRDASAWNTSATVIDAAAYCDRMDRGAHYPVALVAQWAAR